MLAWLLLELRAPLAPHLGGLRLYGLKELLPCRSLALEREVQETPRVSLPQRARQLSEVAACRMPAHTSACVSIRLRIRQRMSAYELVRARQLSEVAARRMPAHTSAQHTYALACAYAAYVSSLRWP
jgi:hypothetical protein